MHTSAQVHPREAPGDTFSADGVERGPSSSAQGWWSMVWAPEKVPEWSLTQALGVPSLSPLLRKTAEPRPQLPEEEGVARAWAC